MADFHRQFTTPKPDEDEEAKSVEPKHRDSANPPADAEQTEEKPAA